MSLFLATLWPFIFTDVIYSSMFLITILNGFNKGTFIHCHLLTLKYLMPPELSRSLSRHRAVRDWIFQYCCLVVSIICTLIVYLFVRKLFFRSTYDMHHCELGGPVRFVVWSIHPCNYDFSLMLFPLFRRLLLLDWMISTGAVKVYISFLRISTPQCMPDL